MLPKWSLPLFAAALALSTYSPVSAENSFPFESAVAGTPTGTESAITEASDVYKRFLAKTSVSPSILENAKCIAVFPSVVTAAFAIGGTRGHGIGFCKVGATGWSNPIFLKLTGGSVGLQIGYQSSDIVLYMSGDEALNSMKNGSFRFSQGATAVAGASEETDDFSKSQTVAYTTSGGLFVGASLSGVIIDRDLARQQEMNGTLAPAAVFESRVPTGLEGIVKEIKTRLPA